VKHITASEIYVSQLNHPETLVSQGPLIFF
jgi:hypothetical protein